MSRKYHILFILLLLGFTLCLTDGFADADAFPWERVTFPTPQGDGYIQGTPEFQRVPEVIIGDPDFEKLRDLPPDSQDYGLSRKVGLIFVPARDDPDQGSICTGFLVGPDLFMTNHHCIRDASGLLPLEGAEIYMDYYQDPDVDPTGGGVTAGVSGVLRADAWKDYALLRLDTPIGNTYGWLTLDTTTPVNSSQSVKLISHNRGRSKEIVRKNSQIAAISAGHPLATIPFALAYFADSQSGSSGSPVFLRDGTGVIGIHHSAWRSDFEPYRVNAGSLMSYIVYEIQEWLPSGTALPSPPKPSTKLLYWAEWGEERIQRANLNGTSIQYLVTSVEPQGIAFDVAGGKMYWTDWNTGKIQRANLNGTNLEDLVTPIEVPSIALDVEGGKMYWINFREDKIQRANLNGANVEDLITPSDALDLALDIVDGKMYWTDWNTGKIQRANLNGTDIEDLVTGVDPEDIALDVAGGKMYWTNPSRYWGRDKIQRANLNGTNIEDLVTGYLSPADIALDVEGGKMYWTNQGEYKIQRANLNGTNLEDFVTGVNDPASVALYVPEQQAPRPPTQPPTRPPTLSLSAVGDQTFTVGEVVTLTLPSATGGTSPYTYTLSPIPAGLQFDPAKRELTGTPTTPGTINATYTATDASGETVSLTFRITVTPPPLTFNPSTVSDQTFTADTPITPLTLPVATGGTSPYTYTLSPIPAGLQFDAAKRELTGTPTTPGTTSLTYTATSANGQTAALTFRITVPFPPPAPLSFDPSTVANQTFIVDTPITPLVLPLATGGRPPYTYRISPTPIGFRFESAKRELTGTPTIPGTVTVTYIATDVSRETVSLKFKVTVITPIALKPSRVASQEFRVDTLITPLVLPLATGGTAPYTYTLSPIPEGLAFDAATRALTGTPTTVGTTSLTYTAIDASEQTVSLRFTLTVIAEAEPDLPADVNADGEVSIVDLVIVALSYGTQVPTGINLPADVNADGVVNLLDIMAVTEAIDAAGGDLNELSLQAVEDALGAAVEEVEDIEGVAAAPRQKGHRPVLPRDIGYRNVATALADAKRLTVDDRLLAVLQLLTEMATIPEATALLPNYPNPFNPETWLPYHLSTPAEVTLSIYSVEGRLVRRLDLGHQHAGVYHSKQRAAYWDGKNQQGEPVASGLYFYTLTAGKFNATRKLLIAK